MVELTIDMLPIGPLMIEHRLIDRVVVLLERQLAGIRSANRLDIDFINAAVDFFSFYADRVHHGKEEDILFTGLMNHDISGFDKAMIENLKNDHSRGRELIAKLEADVKQISSSWNAESLKAIAGDLEDLIKLYKEHIHKEDKEFFIPAMKYLTKPEQSVMLRSFWEFDRELIHEKYRKIVEVFEKADY